MYDDVSSPHPLLLRGRPPPRPPRLPGSGQAGQGAVTMQVRGAALVVVVGAVLVVPVGALAGAALLQVVAG